MDRKDPWFGFLIGFAVFVASMLVFGAVATKMDYDRCEAMGGHYSQSLCVDLDGRVVEGF